MNDFKLAYPIAIEWGDETHAFGIVVPDLPGCFSAGDTFYEAIKNAREAISSWIEIQRNDGKIIPTPSNLMTAIKNHPEYANWEWGVVIPNHLGTIQCSFCGEQTPIEEIGIDHICHNCFPSS